MILLLGLVITILLPIKLTVEEFGYWQLYFFYSSFVGLFMLGMADGIHLRFAGIDYTNLNKKRFRLYFRFTLLHSFTMFLIISLLITYFVEDSNRAFALFFISLNIVIFNINGFFIHVNQVTSRFKYYSWGIVLDRIIFVLSIIPMILLSFESYKYYVILNILSRSFVIIYHIFTSKELVFGDVDSFIENKKDILSLMKTGMFLTISSILSMLLISFPRLIIDKFYGIEEFATFSFANSILSIGIQLVIAASTVIYPMLKKMDQGNYEETSNLLNISVWIFGAIILSIYFPIEYFILMYLPKYQSILNYLFILFPMMIYQCKNNIVITTLFKTLRFEKEMLLINLCGITVNIFVTLLSFYFFKTIISIIAASVCCFAIWVYISDIYIKMKCNWKNSYYYLDFLILISFISTSQIQNWIIGLFVYILCLLSIALLFKTKFIIWYGKLLCLLRNKASN